MDKIRNIYLNLSIKKTFVIIMIFTVITTIVLSLLTVDILATLRLNYYEASGNFGGAYSYSNNRDEFEFVITEFEGGGLVGNVLTYAILFSPIFWFLLIMFVMSRFFYDTKIKNPVSVLMDSAAKICDKDLDFKITYSANDELGKLCIAFESMRYELIEQFKREWRIAEERQKVNKIFAHDVRTPITIVKGHLQVLNKQLQKNAISQSICDESLAVSFRNLDRLESYVHSLEMVSKVSDTSVELKSTDLKQYWNSITDEIKLCHKSKSVAFIISNEIGNANVMLDDYLVSRILHNIVNNAVDFSKEIIHIKLRKKHQMMVICVEDDGDGFSSDSLKLAKQPFYSETAFPSHDGLGLYICDVMLHLIGGELRITNTLQGANVEAYIPLIDSQV